MGRPKGGKNRKYTVEEKIYYVKLHLEEHKSIHEIERETGVANGLICKWTKQYLEDGEEGLKPKQKKGNPITALHTSKSLSETERLKLENMKLKIENERLKKGYTVKGVGADKEFVIISEKNMKS